jgi:hypothetical protein
MANGSGRIIRKPQVRVDGVPEHSHDLPRFDSGHVGP